MKLCSSFTLILFLWLTACQPNASTKNYLSFKNFDDLQSFLSFQPERKPLVSVHRGGGVGEWPENCIESFEFMTTFTSPIIEMDIRKTKDGVLVMLHDDSLGRTTTGTGKLADFTYDEIKDLFLKTNDGVVTSYRIPTLEEVLKWGKDKAILSLDVKRNVPFSEVVELVNKYQANSYAFIITYSAQAAREVFDLHPDLMISVTIRNEEEYNYHTQLQVPDARMIAFSGLTEPNKAHIDFLHSKGISAMLGTLGNLDQMAEAKGDHLYLEWAKLGIDMFATDRPIEVAKVLDDMFK